MLALDAHVYRYEATASDAMVTVGRSSSCRRLYDAPNRCTVPLHLVSCMCAATRSQHPASGPRGREVGRDLGFPARSAGRIGIPKPHRAFLSNFSTIHIKNIQLAKMPSKLAKVQKHVSKKKGSKINSLHENSRDARRLRNAGARDDRVARLTAVRQKANGQWLERVAFFQDNLPETLHPLDVERVRALIEEYLARNNEELEQLNAERRPGRPPSTRFTLLEQLRDVEKKEYAGGFWMPNLQDAETLVNLDAWKGDWISLGNLRFVRVHEGSAVKESQFPPRGAS